MEVIKGIESNIEGLRDLLKDCVLKAYSYDFLYTDKHENKNFVGEYSSIINKIDDINRAFEDFKIDYETSYEVAKRKGIEFEPNSRILGKEIKINTLYKSVLVKIEQLEFKVEGKSLLYSNMTTNN